MNTPLTELRLLNNVDLDTTYANTLSKKAFASSLTAQIAFFQAKTAYTFTQLTFQRKERSVVIKKKFEEIEPLSYGMFKNGVNKKWYFFFITNLEYISDTTTLIKIEIDVEQTYLFDYSYAECFIEREHVDSDDIGEHLIEENLSTGDYTVNDTAKFEEIQNVAFCVSVSEIWTGSIFVGVTGGLISGVYSGTTVYGFHTTGAGIIALNIFLLNYVAQGKTDAIVSVFTIPDNLLSTFSDGDNILGDAETATLAVTKNYDLDGYTAQNNKLYVYPYNFMYVSNNNGSVAIHKYELSTDSAMNYKTTCNIAPSPTVILYLQNYAISGGDINVNFDENLRLSDYPICSWNSDVFKNWIAQNAVSIPVSIASSALSLGVGLTTGNPIAIAGGVIGVASSIGSIVEKNIIPNQVKGSISGSLNISLTYQTFTFYAKSIRAEYALIIDRFLTKYGYKVNILKTPNVESRLRHNYLKLHDAIIQGNIPRDALKIIINNRITGITMWHLDEIGDYSHPNTIT